MCWLEVRRIYQQPQPRRSLRYDKKAFLIRGLLKSNLLLSDQAMSLLNRTCKSPIQLYFPLFSSLLFLCGPKFK